MEEIIELKGSLKNISQESVLLQKIKDETIAKFPNYLDIRMNVDFINQICNAIENSIEPNQKHDKLDLLLKIHKFTFGVLEPKDEQTLKGIVEYLHKNDKIKARSFLSKLYRFLKSFLGNK